MSLRTLRLSSLQPAQSSLCSIWMSTGNGRATERNRVCRPAGACPMCRSICAASPVVPYTCDPGKGNRASSVEKEPLEPGRLNPNVPAFSRKGEVRTSPRLSALAAGKRPLTARFARCARDYALPVRGPCRRILPEVRMERYVVATRLKPGAAPAAEELLFAGPAIRSRQSRPVGSCRLPQQRQGLPRLRR